jgi:hypothetical protein
MARNDPDDGVTDTPSKTTGALPDRNPAAVRLDCVRKSKASVPSPTKKTRKPAHLPKTEPRPPVLSKQPVEY